MKKEMVLKKTKVFGDYGKKRLLDCSASFQDLAKTFLEIPCGSEAREDRYGLLLEKSKTESRTLLAEHLFEMADIMSEVAEESICGIHIEDRIYHKIEKELKEKGIELIALTLLQDKRKRYKLVATMKTEKASRVTIKELGCIISTYLDLRVRPARGSVSMLKDVEESVIYEEESKYEILTGVATATKENEKISGDNYTITEGENGHYYMALSDGAGSGEQANRASKTVIELLEKFIDAGFSLEMAIQMINGVLLASEEEQNLSTLDICYVNTHTGECEFIKVGACNSYIKSDTLIEVVVSGNLPLGVFYRVEIEKTEGQLNHADYVILLSDGVIEGLGGIDRLEQFEETLARVQYESPQEMANFILSFAIHSAEGKIRDDMTVLVLGIWENSLQFD